MKLHKLSHLIALGSVLAFATAGCRHTPVGVTNIPKGSGGTATVGDPNSLPGPPPTFVEPSHPNSEFRPSNAPPLTQGTPFVTGNPVVSDPKTSDTKTIDIPTNGIPPVGGDGFKDYIADPTILHVDTIYFEYDKSAVKSSEESKLGDVITYLKTHPTHALRVEGNCDERGTEEYNRSLGDRRAMSAREYLAAHGVDASHILTASYGKDKPVDTGHDEKAYSQNRRDDFVVLVPPPGK